MGWSFWHLFMMSNCLQMELWLYASLLSVIEVTVPRHVLNNSIGYIIERGPSFIYILDLCSLFFRKVQPCVVEILIFNFWLVDWWTWFKVVCKIEVLSLRPISWCQLFSCRIAQRLILFVAIKHNIARKKYKLFTPIGILLLSPMAFYFWKIILFPLNFFTMFYIFLWVD